MRKLTKTFQNNTEVTPEQAKAADNYQANLLHLLRSNIDSVYKTLGERGDNMADQLEYNIYSQTGMIANFLSLRRDPALADSYDDLDIGKEHMLVFYQRLHNAKPDTAHSVFELPQDTIDSLDDGQRGFYEECKTRRDNTPHTIQGRVVPFRRPLPPT